jgi:hypothetical protein
VIAVFSPDPAMDISSPFLRRSLIAPEMMLGIVRRSSCDTGPPLIVSSSITVVPFRCASIMIVDITFVAYFGNHMLPATETASDQLTGPVIIVRDRTTQVHAVEWQHAGTLRFGSASAASAVDEPPPWITTRIAGRRHADGRSVSSAVMTASGEQTGRTDKRAKRTVVAELKLL